VQQASGVVDFQMGDGSMRALSLSTDPSILALLPDISDGQLIPDF